MSPDVIRVIYESDINRVSLYTVLAAMILASGVLVLCSRGIIRDPFEERLFRHLTLGVLCLAVTDGALVIAENMSVTPELYMLLMTLNELVLNGVILIWFFYINYRVYKSRDYLRRGFIRLLIPLFAVILIHGINLINSFLALIDQSHVWHASLVQGICELIRFFYLAGCGILVLIEKKRRRQLQFLALGEFILPVASLLLISIFVPYSVLPLGFAIGVTSLYAGVINETGFQDRQTGYYNRFYMPYLKNTVQNGRFALKSAMRFRLEDEGQVEAFSKAINPLLPKNCVIIRFDRNTVLMLAEVSEKVALHMLEEDVEDAVSKLRESGGLQDISVKIDTLVKKKKETAMDFYEMLMEKPAQSPGEQQGC